MGDYGKIPHEITPLHSSAMVAVSRMEGEVGEGASFLRRLSYGDIKSSSGWEENQNIVLAKKKDGLGGELGWEKRACGRNWGAGMRAQAKK